MLSLATLATIVFVINKNKNQIFENGTNPNTIKVQTVSDSLEINTFQESTISLDSMLLTEDTLKKKKVDIKKSTIPLKIGTFTIQNTVVPLLKMDSIQIIDSKILLDTMMVKPKAKGGRLLFEIKETLSKSEFEAIVQKVLQQTKTDFGSLVIVKAKGHQPFSHLVKVSDSMMIPHNQIKTLNSKNLLLKTVSPTIDSLNFYLKK
ncbi:MAG: hypothetical protein EOO46_22975 [Flavobacterium sp.]|nr:MAG: hypothetical protein EOO46_22975 [Flavobacterium sp.]